MSDNPYQLTFELKQHTPIIHFQHDQAGATLRATEVKPKLDRFILTKLGDGIYEDGVKMAKNDNLLVGKGEHPALDYKLRVKPISDIQYFLPLPMRLSSKKYPEKDENLLNFISEETQLEVQKLVPTLYFGNADKIKFMPRSSEIDGRATKPDEIKFAVFTNSLISIIVHSFHSSLLKILSKNIYEFFLLENFGTRQNKGFGSFTVKRISTIPLSDKDGPNLRTIFQFRTTQNYKELNNIFSFIKDEYQLLKSGVNFKNYHKSKLFKHFVEDVSPPFRWEKRYLKQFIISNKINSKSLYSQNLPIDLNDTDRTYYNEYKDIHANEYRYIRALLGLAERYEFLIFNDNHQMDFVNKYNVLVKHKPKPGKENIERFKSPLFFKVIDGNVYLKSDDTYKSILGEEFAFDLMLGDDKNSKKPIPSIKIPQSFNIDNFLNKHLSKSSWTTNF